MLLVKQDTKEKNKQVPKTYIKFKLLEISKSRGWFSSLELNMWFSYTLSVLLSKFQFGY